MKEEERVTFKLYISNKVKEKYQEVFNLLETLIKLMNK